MITIDIEGYLAGRPMDELAREAGVSVRHYRRLLAKESIQLRTVGKPRVLAMNERFFQTWSKEMAYVLGLVITDGCIITGQVVLVLKDKELLEKVAAVVGSNSELRMTTRGLWRLGLASNQMIQDLALLGVGEKKSLTINPPYAPREYQPHYMRGIFDGDGHISKDRKNANIATGSEWMAKRLRSILEANGFRCSVYTRFDVRFQKHPIHRIQILGGREGIMRFGRWIYNDADNLYLDRKFNGFNRLV